MLSLYAFPTPSCIRLSVRVETAMNNSPLLAFMLIFIVTAIVNTSTSTISFYENGVYNVVGHVAEFYRNFAVLKYDWPYSRHILTCYLLCLNKILLFSEQT